MSNTLRIQAEVPVGTQVQNLLKELLAFGKGARASKEAKRIRRNLRALGYRINDPSTHHFAQSKELPKVKVTQESTEKK